MPSLTDLSLSRVAKILLIGDSGTGKTGAQACLALAGYNLRMLDFEGGFPILISAIKKQTGGDHPTPKQLEDRKAALARIHIETLIDPVKNGIPTEATAWTKAKRLMDGIDEWKAFGPITTWTDRDILSIDSLTFLSNKAIMNYVLALNNRLGARSGVKGGKELSHFGTAQEEVEILLSALYSTEVKCNVIVSSHITALENAEEVVSGYPTSIGNKLSPKIPRYFNTMLRTKSVGSGPNARRVISTVSDSFVAAKTETLDLPAELPLETGLLQVFNSIRGPLT